MFPAIDVREGSPDVGREPDDPAHGRSSPRMDSGNRPPRASRHQRSLSLFYHTSSQRGVSPTSSTHGTSLNAGFLNLPSMLRTVLSPPEHLIFPRERLRLFKKQTLGTGAFGDVVRGELLAADDVPGPRCATHAGTNPLDEQCAYRSGSPVSMNTLSHRLSPLIKESCTEGDSKLENACKSAPGDMTPVFLQECDSHGKAFRKVDGKVSNSEMGERCSSVAPNKKGLAPKVTDVHLPPLDALADNLADNRAPRACHEVKPTSLSASACAPSMWTSGGKCPTTSDTDCPNKLLGLEENCFSGLPLTDHQVSDRGSTPRNTPKVVAIKRVNKAHLSRRQEHVVSFHSELQLCGSLHHPHIIEVYGVTEDEAEVYIVMDVAEGGTLQQYIKSSDIDAVRRVAPRLIAELVLALEYLHSLGVAHRDIKPANVLLTRDCHMRLADFGSACYLDDNAANTFGGTPAYMSPEMVKTSRASATTDLWALGCLLFELFTGHSPFHDENPMSAMAKVKNYNDGATVFPQNFPVDARCLVQQLLQCDPSERLGSKEKGGFDALKKHCFFANFDWEKQA
ncbi:putative protein kinase [Trypanosoma vivax]|nr:putative protein kinase [Trypanosoma vivax]